MAKKIAAMLVATVICIVCAACSKGDFYGTAANGVAASSREVLVSIGDKKPLDAVLTLPKTSGNPPVVLMIQGSGPSDRDETIGENKPFADIARGLAQRGVATLRFDKRTFVYPEDFAEGATIESEVLNDANSAISLLKNDNSIGDIYILGHSLGGMLAPQIAKTNTDVKGIIILAGSPRSLADIIIDQNMAEIDKTDVADVIKNVTRNQVIEEAEAAKAVKEGDKGVYFGMGGDYWASLNKIDTADIAQKLAIPMLILQGSADFQVSVKNDYAAWQQILADKSNAEFKLYDNLNHLFMESSGLVGTADYEKKSTVSHEVISDVADFVLTSSK